MRSAVVWAVCLASLCGTASAQSIYKCKGADGRITYSGTPCPGEGDAFSVKGQSRSGNAATPPPSASQPQATGGEGEQTTSPGARPPLPKSCDNAGALRGVVIRLDSPSTPDDVRGFLAEERFRLLRCEYTRFTPEERRDRDALVLDTSDPNPARRRAAIARIEALYDKYLTPAERTARARDRQR